MDSENYRVSLSALARQFDNYQRLDGREELSALDREAVAESVIHRFETCYDTLWKHLKRYLVETLGLPDVPNSPKPVFRLAAENGLLPGATDTWMVYADARIATAHDYSGKKAEACLALMERFITDAQELYEGLTDTSWPHEA